MADFVDQFGRPITASRQKLYPSPGSHPQDNRPKPVVRAKIYENQSPFTRWEQVNYSRVIAAQVPGIDAALEMKASYAIGDAWHPVYHGDNATWGERMEELFTASYFRDCNILGPAHDWHATLRSVCRTFDVEADYAVWFDGIDTPDHRATGQFQILDFNRIGSGIGWCVSAGNGLDKVKELGSALGTYYSGGFYSGWGSFLPYYIIDDTGSQFHGYRIIDGIIVDAHLRFCGLRILGYNDIGVMAYVDVAKDQLHFNFEAGTWLNQLRGIPALANLLDDCNSVSDIKYYWQQGVMLASQKMVTRKSIEGRPSAGIEETEVAIAQPDGTELLKLVRIENAAAGVVELSTRRGEELGTLDLNRPSMDEREFVKMVETAYFHKHWPRCLIYADDAARAGSRAIAQQVQVQLRKRQMAVERTARWICDRRIAFAMARGELPQNNNLFDPYNYGFSLPGKFTVDEGNDGKMMLSMLGRGCISRGIICNDMGVQEKKILKSNTLSVTNLATAAESISQQFPWLKPLDALNRLDNNGNPNVMPQAEPATNNEPDGDEPPTKPAPGAKK